MERGLKTDRQVQAAIKLLGNGKSFDKILAKGSNNESIQGVSFPNGANSLALASSEFQDPSRDGASLSVEW